MSLLPDRELNKLSLTELGELLQHYNIYAISANMGTTRPSGPELKNYLQRRLKKEDGKPQEPPQDPMYLVLDLNVLAAHTKTNLLLEIERELNPYLQDGNPAVRRKPKEYAREVILAVMEQQLFHGDHFSRQVELLLFEGNYKTDPDRFVLCRGADWVLYSPVNRIQVQQGITSTTVS